jgi:hypothetical protein
MKFQEIWNNIINHAGEQFFTKTNLPFTYSIVNNSVVPDRTKYPLAKSNFEKAAKWTPASYAPRAIASLPVINTFISSSFLGLKYFILH